MRASAAVPMTGAAPVVVRIVVVAGLALLLRAELWLPLASALGSLAVTARRRWVHKRHWLPAQVALVALVHAPPAVDRPSDALMAGVAPARDRQQLIERAAAHLRRRGHADWAAGTEQLGLAGHAAEALPGDNDVGRLVIVTVSAAVGVLALALRLHPGVFVGAFIVGLVAGTELREERRWRPAMLAAHALHGRQHDQVDEVLPLPVRVALVAGSRPVLERARRLLTRSRAPAQHLDHALSAVEEALVSLPVIDRRSRGDVLRHLPEAAAAACVLWMPL